MACQPRAGGGQDNRTGRDRRGRRRRAPGRVNSAYQLVGIGMPSL